MDFEGQKINLGEDFKPGNFDLRDFWIMFSETIRKTESWQYFSKAFDTFLFNLKKGDTEALLTAGISLILALTIAYYVGSQLFSTSETHQSTSKETEEEEKEPPRDFTMEQLRENDGLNGKPIYIALRGEVYDVSTASDFYGEGSGYHCFAGREASRAMARLSFEEEDLANPRVDDLGPFERSTLDDWIQKFKYYKCYPVVGRVSAPPAPRDFKREELLAFSGTQTEVPEGRVDAPIYLAINGTVLDVSYGGKAMYGPGGPYNIFAGKDASRALAKMSFQAEDVNGRYLGDLTEEQRVVLKDWEVKFVEKKKYPVVGRIVD